jgi:hypothetical protein
MTEQGNTICPSHYMALTNFHYTYMQYFDRAEVSARACALQYLVQLLLTTGYEATLSVHGFYN